ncbi:TRPM8 channel-associated factor 2 [Lemmus lemmus]
MVNDKGQVLIAASSYGQGCLVVASHEGYLLHAGLAPFLVNTVSWLCPSPGTPITVHSSLASLVNILGDSGLEALVQPEPGEALGVYCTDAHNDSLTEKLVQFVKHGGGLFIGGQAWCWEEIEHDQEQLLDGISELDIETGGVPSQLLVHGSLAFPLMLNTSLGCSLEAAHYGHGRVVLAAH